MVKQIEMKKCPVCGYYSAQFLFKDGKCNVCVALAPEQKVAEYNSTDTNTGDNNKSVDQK
jgi:hypothetical protein